MSLNWDTVLEGGLGEVSSLCKPIYSSEIRLGFMEDAELIPQPTPAKSDGLLIAKMHGSINWLYCDCCRRTHAVPFDQVSRLGSPVLQSDDGEKLYGNRARPRLSCPYCSVDLSIRLATFSFQKALRAPMFESSLLGAEKALRDAKKWVFMGCSLPAADFEFKYLLKRVQLARATPPEITVVTKASDPADSAALRSCRKFFGEGSLTVFYKGLTQTAIAKILS